MSSMGLIGAWEWKKLFKCAYHLPGLQLIKQSQFLTQLKIAMEKSISADEMASTFVSWIDTCEDLNVNKQWTWEMIEDECTKKNMDQDVKSHLQDVKHLFTTEHGDSVSNVASIVLKRLVIHEKKSKANELGNLQSKIQEFKLMESYLESLPQFILQTSITIHSDASFQTITDNTLLMITICTSLFSVIVTVTGTFLKMPHIYEEKKVISTPYWKNYLVVGCLMLLLVTPRLVLLSVFFGCCRYGFSVVLLAIAFITYGIPFWTYAYMNFRQDGKETWRMILVNFATSMVGPCIIVKSTSSLVFVSSLFSMVGYLTLLGSLQVSSFLWPHLFILSMADIIPFIKLFMIMVPISIITCLFSYIQLEEDKQLLALQSGLGSICCEEKNLLSWALERQYQKVTNHIMDSGNEDLFATLEYDFIDAEKLQVLFRDVCAKGWIDVLEKLMKHPEIDDFILSKDDQGQTGFMHACSNRHVNILKLLLKHPLDFKITIQADNEGKTGFMLMCNIGFIDGVEILLKHPTNKVIIVQQDVSAKTGLIHAYLNKREDVVEALSNHPNNDEMLKVSFQGSCEGSHYDIVELLMKHFNYQEIISSEEKQGKNGFMKACQIGFQGSCEGGWIEVAEFFLTQGNHQIILSKNENGENGFMKACKREQSQVVASLLNHPSISGIINDKDKEGNTGYMKACLIPSISVMNLIHDHTTDPIEREDAYLIFKALCKNFRKAEKIAIEESQSEMQKWQEVLELILTKNEFQEMEDDNSGPIVTDHPSKENVTVISQEVDEKKPLVIHIDTSNEDPTFEFDPDSFF